MHQLCGRMIRPHIRRRFVISASPNSNPRIGSAWKSIPHLPRGAGPQEIPLSRVQTETHFFWPGTVATN